MYSCCPTHPKKSLKSVISEAFSLFIAAQFLSIRIFLSLVLGQVALADFPRSIYGFYQSRTSYLINFSGLNGNCLAPPSFYDFTVKLFRLFTITTCPIRSGWLSYLSRIPLRWPTVHRYSRGKQNSLLQSNDWLCGNCSFLPSSFYLQ